MVIKAEAQTLFKGADGLKASAAACLAHGTTALGLRDGISVTVPCGGAVDLPAHVYAEDEARAPALLN